MAKWSVAKQRRPAPLGNQQQQQPITILGSYAGFGGQPPTMAEGVKLFEAGLAGLFFVSEFVDEEHGPMEVGIVAAKGQKTTVLP
eukprot:694787-Pelagomonas_calceolata.AAC.1